MKLCFSTLGCPGWPWSEIVATTKALGLSGIEVRGVGDKLHAYEAAPFLPPDIEATKTKLTEAKIEIPIFTTAACLSDVSGKDAAMAEAKAYVDLAKKLGTPYIRVLGDSTVEPCSEVDMKLLKQQYEEICDYGAGAGVMPLIETNGAFADTKMLADFMENVDVENKGILWDVHHPYRYFSEAPSQTISNIGKYVKHVHVKDSVMRSGVAAYRMMGYGDVPNDAAITELEKIGYVGYISLEWLKRWNPHLEEPGLVFSHFVEYVKNIAST